MKRSERQATEATVLADLRTHFSAREYALIPQVRNAAGFGANRTADLLVMSLWPSRGLYLEGIEIKVSRYDLLKELRDPRKAEETGAYCDFYSLATPPGLVEDVELPATWGLYECGDGKVVAKVRPKPLQPKPIDKSFLAALLRRAMERVIPKAEIEAEVNAAVKKATAALRESLDRNAKFEADRIERESEKIRRVMDLVGGWHPSDEDIRAVVPKFKEFKRLLEMNRLGSMVAAVRRDAKHAEEHAAVLLKTAELLEAKIGSPQTIGASDEGNS